MREGWTLKKEISVGDLVAICMAICAALAAYFAIDKRVAILERDGLVQMKIDTRQDDDLNRMKSDVKDELRTMNEKLDKLLYRVAGAR